MPIVRNTSGGAAAGSGFDFQAAVGTIAYIHALRGTPVHWCNSWTPSAPTSVSFETGGPGDDLSLVLADATTVEVQVKKGLTASGRFWSAIESLCDGISSGGCEYGILAVCPQSSLPVRQHYALALRRVGENSEVIPSEQQTKLTEFLAKKGYDPANVCSRMRIKTVPALIDDDAAVAAAKAELGHVCTNHKDVTAAWNALYRNAMSAISTRGRRTLADLISVLLSSQVELSSLSHDSPSAISISLLNSTKSRTAEFEILGMRRPLDTDYAWIPLTAILREGFNEPNSTLEDALEAYHDVGEGSSGVHGSKVDARTIGTFRHLCVVLGGPGSGKSLLLDVLAREFSKDSLVSIRVRLRELAKRMERDGCTVEEGICALGLDGTGVSPNQFRAATLSELIILCDGLDECGNRQSEIASGLRRMAETNPSNRIIVTTRSIGYTTSYLRSWRHYEIVPLASVDIAKHLQLICLSGSTNSVADEDILPNRIDEYLKERDFSRLLARTPLLLALGASLILESSHPCRGKSELYARIFKLIDDTPSSRKDGTGAPNKAIRDRVLNDIGWHIVEAPLLLVDDVTGRCAEGLQSAMGIPSLQALLHVQQSIAYWESVGLIERLNHAGVELIAFIHKTCGEFAAARRVVDMDLDQATQFLHSRFGSSDWNEVCDFAVEMSTATIMVEMFYFELDSDEPNLKNLAHLFTLLTRPDTALQKEALRALVDRVFDRANSVEPKSACRAGVCLTSTDISHLPETKEMAMCLLTSQNEWTRLIGWAVLANWFSNEVEKSRLEEEFNHFLMRSQDDEFFAFRSHAISGPLPNRRVFEDFLISSMRSVLDGKEVVSQDRVIARIYETHRDLTVRFVSRFDAVLMELGREDAMRLPLRSSWRLPPVDFLVPPEFGTQSAMILKHLVAEAFVEVPSEPPPQSGLKFLSAFIIMSGLLEVPASDIFTLRSNDEHLVEIHTLFRSAAAVFGLSSERLAAEAQRAIELVDGLGDEVEGSSVFSVLPYVDAKEPQWERARVVCMDAGVLDTLVHHHSYWVNRLAARLQDARVVTT